MSEEYGLFSNEGIVEGGFYSPEEAIQAREQRYDPEDDLEVEEVCPEHPDQPRLGCEERAEAFYADLDEEEEEEA
jgi:hypothetical protein